MPRSLLVALACALLAPAPARAANIVWGPATTISGDANVVNSGSALGAFNVGATGVPSTTVNGVTFAPFAVPDFSTGTFTQGNFALTTSPNSRIGAASAEFGSTAAPFSNLSASYQSLLRSGVIPDSDGRSFTLTMSSLTVGTAYTFQFWANDSEAFVSQASVTATAGNSVTLDGNTTNAPGGVGQFALGNFVADSSTQAIVFSRPTASDLPLLNGFQLRTAPVPEPATVGLAACAGLGAVQFVRRRVRG